MHKNYICTILILVTTFAVNVFAEPITFRHKGTGSGTIDGTPFTDAAFTITAYGDTDSRDYGHQSYSIDHTSASIEINGLGTLQFITETRTSVGQVYHIVGFGRAGGLSLFSGPSNDEFRFWRMGSSVGPISGSGDIHQWDDRWDGPVITSAGVLVFNDAPSPAIFQARIIPTQAALLFEPAVNYGASNDPTSLAIGDFDGDDNPDIAVANAGSDNVSVLLGKSDGTFQTAVNFEAGGSPRSVAVRDFNGDGDFDLVLANNGSFPAGNVSVLLGNGDGTFKVGVIYDGGPGVQSVAVGDLNGDANPDLAVCTCSDYSVLFGNGDGTFQSAVVLEGNLGACWHSVAIEDLNGDGNLDLVISGFLEGAGHVRLGNGDGTFQNGIWFQDSPHGYNRLAIEDLNGDGSPDLVHPDRFGQFDEGVKVMMGNGDGNFQSGIDYVTGDGSTSLAIGDFDGDDNPDIAVANSLGIGNVSVLLGNGDGTFQSARNYEAGEGPQDVAIGDFNHDRNLDLAVANADSNNVSVLIRRATIIPAYTPVTPCRIVDTRKAGGIIGVSTQRDFRVFGSGSAISAQGGNSSGCPSPLGQPLAAHLNMIAVNPTGKGNLQAFPVGVGTGTGLSVNYNAIDTNLANAGTVKTVINSEPDITVASNFSSAHTVIDVLGYYYPAGELLFTPVTPCRIVDTRKAGGIIGASTQRNFHVFGDSSTIGGQGGNSDGCSSPLGQPLAAHINMIAVNPTGKGNLQAFPVGAGTGAGLSVNYNTIDTNLADAGTVKTVINSGPDITVASNFSSAHTVMDVLGYYYPDGDFTYTPVNPCRIVDTRKTSAGMIGTSTERDFHVYGNGSTISAQGGNSAGCPAPMGEPLAAHINMVAVNPTGKGNLQSFPVGAGAGAGLSVNYNAIDTNLADAGTVGTVTGAGADITVASNFSSAHTVIDVLGYYYPAP